MFSRRDFNRFLTAALLSSLTPRFLRADYMPPQAHPRLFWDSATIQLARQQYDAAPWSPAQLMDNATLAVIHPENTDNISYLIDQLNQFVITPDQGMRPDALGCDQYRWNQWVPFALDVAYPYMTTNEQQAAIQKYGTYVRTIMQQGWGGPSMISSNYFWGNFTWEIAYAVAAWYEEDTSDVWNFAQQRWQNFIANDNLGAAPEGSAYGQVQYSYPILPWLGVSEFNTPWFGLGVRFLAHWISPVTIGDNLHVFTWNDDEGDNGGGDVNSRTYLGDFLTAAQRLCSAPDNGHAATVLQRGITTSQYIRTSIAPAAPVSLSDLPLDENFGICYCSRQSWNDDATRLFIQLNDGVGGGHLTHADFGSFQIAKGNQLLVHEWQGYQDADSFADSDDPNGFIDAKEAGCHSVFCVLSDPKPWAGYGPMRTFYLGWATILEEESTAQKFHLKLDMTPCYRANRGDLDRSFIEHIERHFDYDRINDILTITDRVQTNGDYLKRFQITLPTEPTKIDNVTWQCGNFVMKNLLPSDAQYTVVDNGKGSYRLDVTSYESLFIHELHFGSINIQRGTYRADK